MKNDLERAIAYLEARFPSDARGRMTCEGRDTPPPFAFARTPLGCVWRLRSDLPPESVMALAKYAAREAGVENPAAARLPERLEPMRKVVGADPREVRVERLLLHCATATFDEDDSVPQGSSASEALAFLTAAGHAAISWGDACALAEVERRSLRLYGDLLLIG